MSGKINNGYSIQGTQGYSNGAARADVLYNTKTGNVDTNFDWSNVSPEERQQIEQDLEKLAKEYERLDGVVEHKESLMGQLDPARKAIAAEEILSTSARMEEVEQAMSEIAGELKKSDPNVAYIQGLCTKGRDAYLNKDLYVEAEKGREAELAAAKAPVSAPAYVETVDPEVAEISFDPASKTDGASGSSGSGEADGSKTEEAPPHDFIGKSSEELLNIMENDEEAFYAELRNMGVKDRSLVMDQIQRELQEINQMFSMLSNFQKSMHDTQKGIINNLRV